MKKLFYFIIPVILGIIAYSFMGGESETDYVSKIEASRKDKAQFMRSSKQSPFVQKNIEPKPLKYYPANSNYRVPARIEKIPNPDRVIINNSDGSSQVYLKYAWLSFKVNSNPLKLLVLKPTGFGAASVFLTAFSDLTSGDATYGGGRYLDVSIGKSDKMIIDFNLAYNPYCAYVSDYTCPLPPPENMLDIKIEAGEKSYGY